MRADRIAVGLHLGCLELNKAPNLLTWGQAMDVPNMKACWLFLTPAARMSTPGVAMSGFSHWIRAYRMGPLEENPATLGAGVIPLIVLAGRMVAVGVLVEAMYAKMGKRALLPSCVKGMAVASVI
ncbi:hypothetical protein KC19_VG019300 [Ceratodon purpureus]|uniref:Uncharacterized protein n=1 Tax=Ceratodon purpureus TaxID=3225 RepID=A0A8T0HL30_CERPU|nr:hypothetical protein KC19_VG019300 [Ceratodon purpureus]